MCHMHETRVRRYGDPTIRKRVQKVSGSCSVGGCDLPNRSRGLCNMHYARMRRTGDPLKARPRYSSTEESFMNRTAQDGECIVWVGTICGWGYGIITVQGEGQTSAHRYAWARVNGPIPDGLFVDHICHNRACVNVEHLRLATQAQNNMNRSGAQSTGASGIRGVRWEPTRNRWVAQVACGEKHYGKYHKSIHSAVEDVNRVRREWFGEFAGPESVVPDGFVHPR
jgi:hypothetical protein